MTAAAAAAPKALSKRRRFVIWALIVVASILAVVTVLTLWINRQVLDNDNWRQTSADLIADPAVQNTLSVYLVDQLYDLWPERSDSRPRARSIVSLHRRDCSRPLSIRARSRTRSS